MARARKGRKFPQPGGNYSFRVLAVSTGVFVVANLILLVASTTTASFQYKVGTIYKAPENIPEALVSRLDAILVLGGGVPTSLEEPPIYVQRRCDDAATVVTQKKTLLKQRRGQDSYSTDIPILCLSAGTAHLHQLMDPQGLPIWESTSSAAYLKKKHGLTHLFVETASYDTIGNAFYARTGHTDLADWRRLLIITNEVRDGGVDPALRVKVYFAHLVCFGSSTWSGQKPSLTGSTVLTSAVTSCITCLLQTWAFQKKHLKCGVRRNQPVWKLFASMPASTVR